VAAVVETRAPVAGAQATVVQVSRRQAREWLAFPARDGVPWRMAFVQALQRGLLVLDGGLATELEARGHDLTGELWSAGLLVRNPGAVGAAHLAYYRAGADVATTASYQASLPGFERAGLSRPQGEALLRESVALADRARTQAVCEGVTRPLFVAASVGPYGAARADGSEYTGDYDLDVAGLRRFHRPRLEVLACAGADVLALETLPCLAEVEALLLELERLDGPPAWLSLTCAGGRTRRGEEPAEAFAMAAEVAAVVAVGVNCTAPDDVDDLLPATAAAGKPVLAYPNSGEIWDPGRRTWTGRGTLAATRVREWLAAGVAGVGGCCRVGPHDIAAVAEVVRGFRAGRAGPVSPRRPGGSPP
jgi:homocysteine S-methyltransferase